MSSNRAKLEEVFCTKVPERPAFPKPAGQPRRAGRTLVLQLGEEQCKQCLQSNYSVPVKSATCTNSRANSPTSCGTDSRPNSPYSNGTDSRVSSPTSCASEASAALLPESLWRTMLEQNPDVPFKPDDRHVLGELYCPQEVIPGGGMKFQAKALSGYSGDIVLQNQTEQGGFELTTIAKLGDRDKMVEEYQRSVKAAQYYQSSAPGFDGMVQVGDRAGIRCHLARHEGNPETLQTFFTQQPIPEVMQVVKKIVNRMPKAFSYPNVPEELRKDLHEWVHHCVRPATNEVKDEWPKLHLWQLFPVFTYDKEKALSIMKVAETVFGADAVNRRFQLSAVGQVFPNPFCYDPGHFEIEGEGTISVALMHGDLHPSNILVDQNRNVFFIDHANFGLSHALDDLTKLECSWLLFPQKGSPEPHQAEKWLKDALAVVKKLAQLRTSWLVDRSPSFEPSIETSEPGLQKIWTAVNILRAEGFKRLGSVSVVEYQISLYRWSLCMSRYHQLKGSQVHMKLAFAYAGYLAAQLHQQCASEFKPVLPCHQDGESRLGWSSFKPSFSFSTLD